MSQTMPALWGEAGNRLCFPNPSCCFQFAKKNLFEHLPIVPRFKRDLCGPKIEITMFEQNMDFCCIHTAINTGWELVRCLTDRLNKYLASLLQQCYLNIFSTFATHGLLQHLFVCLPGLYLNDSFLGQSPIAPNWSVPPKLIKNIT